MKQYSWLKKAIAVISAVSAVSIPVSAVSASADWYSIGLMGDVNNDSKVNIADLVAFSRNLLGIEPFTAEKNCYYTNCSYISIDGGDYFQSDEYFLTSDINQDGRVNVFDFLMLRKMIVASKFQTVWQWFDETPQTTETTATTVTETDVTTTTTVSSSFSESEVSTTAEKFINPPVYELYGSLPSQNRSKALVFYVDFPDCKYDYEPSTETISEIAFGEEDTSDPNYPYESISAFYKRSSKGAMELTGEVFRYTTKENKSAYENDAWKVKLVKEIMDSLDGEIDFSQFDSDSDSVIDAILISVPTSAGETDWWPCAGQYGGDSTLRYDDMSIGHVITGNAQIESETDYSNFNSSYLHEMGHCMGLPDYYLYNNSSDAQGMHGFAGIELMDDAYGDFSAVSKLMLGWYKKSQIQIYDPEQSTQTFTLTNAQTKNGNCLIIPCGELHEKYYSEFFIVEYASLDENNSNIYKQAYTKSDEGVRVFHVDATNNGNKWYNTWKYANNSATPNMEGRRFIRIIDDAIKNNFYHAGDIIDSSILGFNWYDENERQTIDPEITITVGEKTNDSYTITVSKK